MNLHDLQAEIFARLPEDQKEKTDHGMVAVPNTPLGIVWWELVAIGWHHGDSVPATYENRGLSWQSYGLVYLNCADLLRLMPQHSAVITKALLLLGP